MHHEVIDGGNPIGLDLKTRYVVKGIGKEQTISSRINIFYDKDTGKITKVEDKWDGQLPDSSFQNVSISQLVSPWWWLHYYEGWAWWMWSFTWNTRVWQVGVYGHDYKSRQLHSMNGNRASANHRLLDFSPTQFRDRSYHRQRPEERRGRCEERQPVGRWQTNSIGLF